MPSQQWRFILHILGIAREMFRPGYVVGGPNIAGASVPRDVLNDTQIVVGTCRKASSLLQTHWGQKSQRVVSMKLRGSP